MAPGIWDEMQGMLKSHKHIQVRVCVCVCVSCSPLQYLQRTSQPGQEDQRVCANTPHSFGKQDALDFEIKIKSAKEESVLLRVASSAASTRQTSAPKQDSETVQESLDRNPRFGRVCCGQAQGSLAEVSKDQGVRTGEPGRGTSSTENQGVGTTNPTARGFETNTPLPGVLR